MSRKFNWDAFTDEDSRLAVHCKTLEELKDFISKAKEYNKNIKEGWSIDLRQLFEKIGSDLCVIGRDNYLMVYFYETAACFFTQIKEWEDYMEKEKEFTKEDLRTGMIVRVRSGELYSVVMNVETTYVSGDFIIRLEDSSWTSLALYKNGLRNKNFDTFDIVAVYRGYHPYCIQDPDDAEEKLELLWEEKNEEPTKIQEEVKELVVDNPVLVSSDGKDWKRRHFHHYDKENDVVYAWSAGTTSWTARNDEDIQSWAYATKKFNRKGW